MAGEKGKRSAIQEEKGKGKRLSVQEPRSGEERGPKIRKVTQEETGKRKGKLQIKGRDKPMDMENMRRLEEKTKKLVPEASEEIPVFRRMPEEESAVYRYFVEKEFRYLSEELVHKWPGGLARVRSLNASARELMKLVKEHSARRLEEYAAKGYLEYGPPIAYLPPSTPLTGGD